MRTKNKDPAALGPAMQALSEQQRAFVVALANAPIGQNLRPNAAWAAREAGYSAESATAQACRMMKQDKIMEAIREYALGAMASEAIGLTNVLLDIAYGNVPATATERMKAAAMVFGRIGMPEKSEHLLKVEHSISNDEALEKLAGFARILGVPAEKLIGAMGLEIVEGEFTEIEQPRLTDQRTDDIALHTDDDPAGAVPDDFIVTD